MLALQKSIDSLQTSVGHRIFIGAPNLHFTGRSGAHRQLGKELAKRLWFNHSLSSLQSMLNIPLEEHLAKTEPIRRRLAALRCEKCRLMEWSTAFCNSSHNKNETAGARALCHAFDPTSQLAYFIDEHHYSYLGARRVRKVLAASGREI